MGLCFKKTIVLEVCKLESQARHVGVEGRGQYMRQGHQLNHCAIIQARGDKGLD